MLFPDHDVAVVTGSSRGIGRAIARDLATEGATVVVNYLRSTDAAERLVCEIKAAGGRAHALQADVAVEEDVQRLFKTVARDIAPLRILVNNAGITDDGLLATMSLEKWRHVVSVNLDSAFMCSREAFRLFVRARRRPRPGGAIVNVASISGITGAPGQLNYSASKGGMIALTKGLAKEGARFAVRANAVAPGFVDTDMTRDAPRAIVDAFSKVVPLQRIGQAHEVAPIVSFLASSKASYITGQVIAVDGGFTP